MSDYKEDKEENHDIDYNTELNEDINYNDINYNNKIKKDNFQNEEILFDAVIETILKYRNYIEENCIPIAENLKSEDLYLFLQYINK